MFQCLVCDFTINEEVAALLGDTKHPFAHVPRPDFRSARLDCLLDLLTQRLDAETNVQNAVLELGIKAINVVVRCFVKIANCI